MATEMTDRERILMNIAGMLAHSLADLQRLPYVREYMESGSSLCRIKIDGGFCMEPSPKKGDLVVCCTSLGRQQNPWIVSIAETYLGSADGCLLRSIGTQDTCKYSNESFYVIRGMPERMMREGAQWTFDQKMMKVLRKLDTFAHRFRGIEFISDGEANVWFGECFGGLNNPTKPYAIKVSFTPKTTIKNIIRQLKDGGHGTRKFEPSNGIDEGPFGNPKPITRDDIVGMLAAKGIAANPTPTSPQQPPAPSAPVPIPSQRRGAAGRCIP